jgi:hypothetical protein
MDAGRFSREQFLTLREEIKNTKSRLFWISAMGLFGVPLLTIFASQVERERFVALLVPYFVLVIILMFLAEQNALMRAGRFIRERVEKDTGPNGWEGWLESRPDLRLMDRHFFACFIIVFFVYYFMTIGLALQGLWMEKDRDSVAMSWLVGAVATYAIGAIWALATLIQHWRSCVGTSDE